MFKESSTRSTSGMLHSVPAQRNTAPILEVLERVLPADGTVLEIASGTGQHVVAFAEHFPALRWQPSDIDAELRASVAQRTAVAATTNIAQPIELDAMRRPWPLDRASAVICINMIHIAPWSATEGLFAGAAEILPPGAPLVTYGPYKRGGEHTAPSNASFDASLRSRDASWGVRDVDDVADAAVQRGFELSEAIEMPANNLTLVFHAR